MNKKHTLIKRSALKARAFQILADRRPHLAEKMTRISRDFLEACEAHFLQWLETELDSIPTTGKTIQPTAAARLVRNIRRRDHADVTAELTQLIGYPPQRIS